MSLTEAPIDKTLVINEILSGTDVRRKLSSLGIHINDSIIKVNNTKWGPILLHNISCGTSKVAIGRGLAEKIIVDYGN